MNMNITVLLFSTMKKQDIRVLEMDLKGIEC
jgi:hypothetical protein